MIGRLIDIRFGWIGILLLLICGKLFANHGDISPQCPDVEISGGESITFHFEDYYTGKPYQSGDIIPTGTRMNHYQHAEAYGSCDINIWDPATNSCVNNHQERGIYYTKSTNYGPMPATNWQAASTSSSGKSWTDCSPWPTHVLETGITPCSKIHLLFFLYPGNYVIKNDVIMSSTSCNLKPSTLIGPTARFTAIEPKKNKCPTTDARGNPCSTSTGNKHQREDDFIGPSLPFVRFYNSQFFADIGLGYGWMTSYHKRLAIGGLAISGGGVGERVVLLRSNGASEEFKQQVNGSFLGDADSGFTLVKTTSNYILTDREGNTETYNERGLILSETDAAGNTTTYSYNTNEKLETVTGPYGHQLSFTYNTTSKRLETVTLPDGRVLQYTYQLLGKR